mgnify:CR=1 FL=1
MKILSAILFCLLCCSCSDTDTKTNELNQRVTRLEQRIDSLTNRKNQDSGGYVNQRTSTENDHCKGITKKGTQCKRKAKTNGYCWQHGG